MRSAYQNQFLIDENAVAKEWNSMIIITGKVGKARECFPRVLQRVKHSNHKFLIITIMTDLEQTYYLLHNHYEDVAVEYKDER